MATTVAMVLFRFQPSPPAPPLRLLRRLFSMPALHCPRGIRFRRPHCKPCFSAPFRFSGNCRVWATYRQRCVYFASLRMLVFMIRNALHFCVSTRICLVVFVISFLSFSFSRFLVSLISLSTHSLTHTRTDIFAAPPTIAPRRVSRTPSPRLTSTRIGRVGDRAVARRFRAAATTQRRAGGQVRLRVCVSVCVKREIEIKLYLHNKCLSVPWNSAISFIFNRLSTFLFVEHSLWLDCCSFFLTFCLSFLFIWSLSLLHPPHFPLPPHPTRLLLTTATDGISFSPCGARGSRGPRPLCITHACDCALCARAKRQCDCDSARRGWRGKQRMFQLSLTLTLGFILPPFFVSPLTRTARIHIDLLHASPLTHLFL